MPNEKETIRISKFLSLILRHQPEMAGIILDKEGWTDVQELLHHMQKKGWNIDRAMLEHVVVNNNKQRFAFSDDRRKIRASQGHSIQVELNYQPQQPPDVLYHGTAEKNITSILQQGLVKGKRQHVHLSTDKATAMQVGSRHGKPFVLEVAAGKMFADGYSFFLSANGVWLTDSVPAKFLRTITDA